MKAFVQIDHELTNRIRTWGTPAYGFWRFMAAYSIYAFVVVAIALAIPERLEFGYFALAFATAYVVANLLQRAIKRSRPDFERLTGYKMWLHTYSYPSAHASMSGAAAAALALMPAFVSSTEATLVIVAASLLAILIGLSRIVVGVHYFADVIFGWLLGFVIAWIYWLFLLT
jgi:undecaprenyl-diphosphatase